jgi:hypothetical protein
VRATSPLRAMLVTGTTLILGTLGKDNEVRLLVNLADQV